MSQRVDERKPTIVELDVYNKCLKLTDHTLSVCKVKEEKANRKHLIKRQLKLGQELIDIVVDIGADILQANTIYVGGTLNINDRIENYKIRNRIQNHAKSLTYRMEHIIRVLHFNRPFADSTITYWFSLLYETRNLLIGWKEKDNQKYRELIKQTE